MLFPLCSLMKTLKLSSTFNTDSLILSLSKIAMEHRTHQVKSTKRQLLVLQTVTTNYALTPDCYTYCVCNWSSSHNKTVSSYNVMLAGKVKSQMMAHFFKLKDPIFITTFPAMLKLVTETNHIHKKAAMWVMPRYVYETLANEPKSPM